MILGLGTGRAAEAFIHRLAERVRRGLRIRAVPTSRRSEELSQRLNIEIVSLESVSGLDIAFDGADEVTPDLLLTKGKGGAHLRERVVAYEARQFVVLVTPDKLVEKLGTLTPIPIEVVPFAVPAVTRHLNLNWLLDTDFGPIPDPLALDASIRKIPGIIDTGIFIDMASVVLVGETNDVRELKK
jgi:ribose 5-phosphate isomerase A